MNHGTYGQPVSMDRPQPQYVHKPLPQCECGSDTEDVVLCEECSDVWCTQCIAEQFGPIVLRACADAGRCPDHLVGWPKERQQIFRLERALNEIALAAARLEEILRHAPQDDVNLARIRVWVEKIHGWVQQ